MKNKWLLRFGSFALALSLITGCATNEPADDEAPMDGQEEDMMENEDNGNGEGGNNGN